MASHYIPPETDDKEKIIGGVLDMQQFAFLTVGFLIGAGVALSTFYFLGNFSIVLGLIFGLSGVPFAFYKNKKSGLRLIPHLKRKRAFDKKTKYLFNVVDNKKNKEK